MNRIIEPMQALFDYCQAERAWLREQVETLVRFESPSTDKAAVDRCGTELANRLRALGARATRLRQSERGDHIRAEFAGAGPPVLLLGHFDTVWGVGQLAAGWASDHLGRKPLIVAGMLVQAGALALLVQGGGAFGPSLAAAVLLGAGTALAYPTLIAAVSDAVEPRERAPAVGVYRFWRDSGFVLGALAAGAAADAFGASTAIALVAAVTAASGAWAGATRWTDGGRISAKPMGDIATGA